MTIQQLFQWSLTILFVAVMVQLFVALTIFNVRTFREDWKKKREKSEATK